MLGKRGAFGLGERSWDTKRLEPLCVRGRRLLRSPPPAALQSQRPLRLSLALYEWLPYIRRIQSTSFALHFAVLSRHADGGLISKCWGWAEFTGRLEPGMGVKVCRGASRARARWGWLLQVYCRCCYIYRCYHCCCPRRTERWRCRRIGWQRSGGGVLPARRSPASAFAVAFLGSG